MKKLLSAMALVLASASCHPVSADDVIYQRAVTVDAIDSVYDGDTFTVTVNQWPAVVGHRVPVRIKGVDTPELRGSECPQERLAAEAARRFTHGYLTTAEKVELRNISRDKYFRLLAEVWVDGQSLASALLLSGYAYPYEGGAKTSWCSTLEQSKVSAE